MVVLCSRGKEDVLANRGYVFDFDCLYIGLYDGFDIVSAASFEERNNDGLGNRLHLFLVDRPKGAMREPNYYAVFEHKAG